MSMAFEHRTTERKKAEEELRRQAKQIIELAASAQIAIGQIQQWGGPQAEDFAGDNEANSAARMTETIIGLEAAAMMFAQLQQPVGQYGVTVQQALLRIAAA
jgi:hypothetical protein